jgi:hypothetical protein
MTRVISLEERIEVFAILGGIMRDAAAGITTGHAGLLDTIASTACRSNPWFTPENIRLALKAMGNVLTHAKLSQWLSRYPGLNDDHDPATVGVVMAGNIPLVGFHDLMCTLITGNRLLAKLSTKDEQLMRAITDILISLEPSFEGSIEITADKLSRFDMVIATGSNNTSRYFEYYFRNIPSIIRRNRNSAAIIDGTETDDELDLLADDLFAFFGLGCRNISKLYLPAGYDVRQLPVHWKRYESLRRHYKYMVNYDHNKAVMTVNREPFTDAGYVILRENRSLTSPIAVINYEFYDTPEKPDRELKTLENFLQCVTGHGHVPFGSAQQPELWDYADNIDTILFLLKKNMIL